MSNGASAPETVCKEAEWAEESLQVNKCIRKSVQTNLMGQKVHAEELKSQRVCASVLKSQKGCAKKWNGTGSICSES